MTLGILGERLQDLGYGDTHALADVRRALDDMDDAPALALKVVTDLVVATRRSEDPGARGLANAVRARLLIDVGDLHSAMAASREASADLELAGLGLEAIRAEVVTLRVLRELGQLARADALSATLSVRLGEERVATRHPVDALEAIVQVEHGLTLLALNRADEALLVLDDGWNRARSLGDERIEAMADRGRAEAYLVLGMVHRSLDEAHRAVETFTRLGLHADVASCRTVQARGLVQLKRYSEAIELLESSRAALTGDHTAVRRAQLACALGMALLFGGLVHDALSELREASRAFIDLGRLEDAARTHLTAATAHVVAFDRDRCLREVARAERLAFAVEAPPLRLAPTLLRGAVARRERDDRATAAYGREVLNLLESHTEAVAIGYRAHALLLAAHDPDDAEAGRDHLEEATRLITQSGIEDLRLGLGVTQARRLRQAGRPEEAVEVLRAAVGRSMEDLRADLVDEATAAGRLVLSFAFEELICVLLDQGTPSSMAEAWRWSCLSRLAGSEDYSAAMLSQREHHRQQRPPTLPGVDEKAEVDALSRRFDALLACDASGDDRCLAEVRTESRRLLRSAFPATFPALDLAAPGRGDAVPEGPLLQWHVFGADMAAFVVREGQVYGRVLRGTAALCRDLMDRWGIATARHAHVVGGPSRVTSEESAILSRLSAALVDPVADLLVDLPPGAALAVVGHGPLEEVPLEALHIDDEVLSDRFDLLFAVGIDQAALSERAVVADPFPASGPTTTLADQHILVLAVPDETAPAIADEADSIAQLRPGATVLRGQDASVEALSTLGRSHGLVHIACHGIFDAAHPRGSALRLGDRWVPAGEIAHLDLLDTVVVMNACATGRMVKTGSDMGSLVWSFLAAGAAGVVATTWPVSDAVATEFAEAFHRSLAAGALPATAVAEGRRRVRETFPHPWHWAAFRFTGAADAVLSPQ